MRSFAEARLPREAGVATKAIVRLVTQRAILSWVTCPGSDDFDRASVYGQVLRLPGGTRRHMVSTSSPSSWAAPKPGTYAMGMGIWE
jgi:hypothetical protein